MDKLDILEMSKLEMVVITKEEYARLIKDQAFLEALRGAGVDNWDGYDIAIESMGQ